MSKIKVFFDINVLLTTFAAHRNNLDTLPTFILTTDKINKVTFEKCVFECFLTFRGVNGKKPDEGRGDWAARYLKLDGDPLPIGDAAGKFRGGSLIHAHYWTGQADEATYAIPETFIEYFEDIKKYVHTNDWKNAKDYWLDIQNILENHRRYKTLFGEFKSFLANQNIAVLTYEEIYTPSKQSNRQMIMEALSTRSTVPNEDFEIVSAALLVKSDVFISLDKRLLIATNSIENNIRQCHFIHLDEASQYIGSLS